MLNKLDMIKREIKEWSSEEVDVIIYNCKNDLYDTLVDVYYDKDNGSSFTIGREEKYDDAVKRAKSICEDLKYVNPTIIVNDTAIEGDTIIAEGETSESIVTGRYFEGGEEDNGVRYLNKNGIEYVAFDGCYTIVERNR